MEFNGKFTRTLEQVETYFHKNVDTLCRLFNEHSKGHLYVRELKTERDLIERILDEQDCEDSPQIHLIHDLDYVWSINQAMIELVFDMGADIETEILTT